MCRGQTTAGSGLWALRNHGQAQAQRGKLRFAVWEATWLPQVALRAPMRVVAEAAVLMRCFLFFFSRVSEVSQNSSELAELGKSTPVPCS